MLPVANQNVTQEQELKIKTSVVVVVKMLSSVKWSVKFGLAPSIVEHVNFSQFGLQRSVLSKSNKATSPVPCNLLRNIYKF